MKQRSGGALNVPKYKVTAAFYLFEKLGYI